MAADHAKAAYANYKAQAQPHLQTIQDKLPPTNTVVGILTYLVVGLTVLTIGGIVLAGGAVLLAILFPIFIFFSPILVPVGGILAIGTAGFLSVAGFVFASLAAAYWLYKYVKGDEPVYSDRVDAARNRIAGTTHGVKEWAQSRAPGVVYTAPSA